MERRYRFLTDPPTWLRPDVSLTHPDQPADRFYLGAPLIAFEVVSASETAADLEEKVAEYLANGAAEAWLIYPRKGRAWVYDASGAARLEIRSIHTVPPLNTPGRGVKSRLPEDPRLHLTAGRPPHLRYHVFHYLWQHHRSLLRRVLTLRVFLSSSLSYSPAAVAPR